ncbi:MAG: sugar kinase [Phycisphaeraceae bacterium]|nr:sugar kinase [Phycisphaeraceae bacterium]
MSLVVTGTVSIDSVYTPHAGHREHVLGGSCTYFASAASFYGPVRMVAVVGDDFPDEHWRTLARFESIDTDGLETRSGAKTFRWGGRYMADMNHRETLYTELNVIAEAPPPVPQEYRDSRLVFLANTHPGVQAQMLAQFPDRVLAVADTMDLWIENERDGLVRLLKSVDGLVLNYDEAEQLADVRNTVAAARKILTMGPRFVVVKKGEHGCIFVHKEGIAALPAYPNDTVVDPTGAGDSFAGGMMGHLARVAARGGDATSFDAIRRSLAHGTVIASFCIESFALERMSALTQEEIDRRFDEFAHMMRLH